MITPIRISEELPASVDAAIDRARFRDRTIWPAFQYGGAGGDVSVRWFLVFMNRGEGGWAQLREYAVEELSLIVFEANRTLADVDSDAAMLAAEIVLKRYLATVDDAMERAGLDTRRIRNASELDYFRAQILAVETDRVGLETAQMETSLQLSRIRLECDKLRAEIRGEGLHLSEAEREVAESELRKAEADLRLQSVRLEVIGAQRQLAETALESLGIDLEKASATARVAEIEGRMARLAGEPIRLQIEQAQTLATQEGISGDQERRTALTAIEKDAAILDQALTSWRSSMQDDQLASRKSSMWKGFYCGLLRQTSELERMNQNYDLSAELAGKASSLQYSLDLIETQTMDETRKARFTYPLESMKAEAEEKANAIGKLADAQVFNGAWNNIMGG